MKKLIIGFILLIVSLECYSQAPTGEYNYLTLLKSNDTLVVKRKYGDWWLGFKAGVANNYYFGTLNFTTNNDPGNPFARKIDFVNGSGGGLMVGGIFEWIPINEKWGYGLNINFIENRSVNATSEPLKDTFQTYFDFTSSLNYLNIAPFTRYNFFLPGLHMLAGLDVSINMSQESFYQKKFKNSGNIEQKQIANLQDLPVSFGFLFGFGYDLFIADVSGQARGRITPFATIHLGSSMIKDNNSTWNNIQLKMGLALKLGFDRVEYDTLYYDKEYLPPPVYLVSAVREAEISFPGFRGVTEFASADLKMIEMPQVQAEVETKEIQPAKDLALDNPKTEKPEPKVPESKFNFNTAYKFSFPKSDITDLTPEINKFIDDLSEFLKANPNIRISIVGHSDDAGTIIQRTERSRQRAMKAFNRIVSYGINDNRVLIDFRGSLYPVGPNNTEAGRRQNRRVEITILR